MGQRERRSSRTTGTYSATRSERAPSDRHTSRTLLQVLLAVIGLCAVIVAAGLVSYLLVYGERIPLGVQILDMDVGGLQPAQAKDLLSDNLDAYLRTPVALRYQGWEFKYLPGEFGASFNIDESVARALELGQQGGIFEKIQRQVSYLQHPQRLDPAFVFNDTAFQGGLALLAKNIDRAPQDASIKLVGVEVAVSPSRAGAQIDRAVLQKLLAESFSTLSASPTDVPVRSIPPQIKDEDLVQARKQIEDMTAPITVRYGDRKWTLNRTALSGMLNFQQSKDPSGIIKAQPSVIPDKAEAWARNAAREVDQEAEDPRVVLSGGKVTIISPGRPGVSVETAKFGGTLINALATGDRVIDLPVAVKQPAGSSDLVRLGIKDKIAEASTSYAGTLPDRIHNVQLGAERINGKLVPPGGIFSMAEALGPISEQTGYKLGFAIIGQDTVLDVGGGLSQLTTTVFKAAFAAGFPIVQRTTHSYRIRRYEPVLSVEATIYPPAVDMKFRNDTDNFILVDARTDAGSVYVAIYGTRPNREVSIEGPVVENVVPADREVIREETPLLPKGTEITSEVAEDGIDVTVYRIIKVGGNEVKRERFFTRFRPSHNVVMVGTREQRDNVVVN